MKKFVAIASGAMLAGCGAADAEDGALLAGNWELSMETTAYDVPGADPLDLEDARFEADVGIPNVEEACLSERELAGGLKAMIATVMLSDENCAAENLSVEGGKVTGAIRCDVPDLDGPLTISLDGSYDAERFKVVSRSRSEDATFPQGEAFRTLEFTGRRLGACD